MFDQRRDVVGPLPQGRHVNPPHLDSIEQVFPKRAAGQQVGEVAVGCRNDTDVDPDIGLDGSDRLDFTALEKAQEHCLHTAAHFGHFVEKHRPAMGKHQFSDRVAASAREAASHVAEQFGFEQLIWNPGAVDRDKRAGGTR